MFSKDTGSLFIFFKKASKGNTWFTVNSEKIFFALTSKAVEDVLLNKYSSFKKDGGFKRLKGVLGEGLITSEEPKHMNNKKEISKTFSHSHMLEYETKISEIADSMLSGWSGEINARQEMGFFVFKSVMDIFFSETMDEEFALARYNVTLAADKFAFNIDDDELKKAKKELREFSKKVVDKRLNSKENKNDFLGILINSYNEKKMDITDVYDEAITMLLVAYETSAYVLEWAVYYLSINKEWQEKISKEEHVDEFMKEVLRLCPPIWNAQRVATEDVTVDGIDLPSGTQVMISALAIQRDKDVFEDPDSFKPERWFENKELSKGEYFPFAFGKRQCSGKEFALMEMRIILIKMAKKFNIELVNEKVSHIVGLSFKPRDPIIINVKQK